MKKLLVSLLVFCLLFALAGCGGDSDPAAPGNDPGTSSSAPSGNGATTPEVDENEPITEEMLRAYPEAPASDFEYYQYGDNIVIEKYIGTDPIVVIPAEIDGCPVTELYTYIFSNKSQVRAALIPASIACVPEGLFANNEVVEVIICEGATEADDLAFFNCASLRTVILGDGLETLGEMALAGNVSLEKVRIPASLTSISDEDAEGMFYGSRKYLTIYGEAGSYIETYAAEQGIAFQAE